MPRVLHCGSLNAGWTGEVAEVYLLTTTSRADLQATEPPTQRVQKSHSPKCKGGTSINLTIHLQLTKSCGIVVTILTSYLVGTRVKFDPLFFCHFIFLSHSRQI